MDLAYYANDSFDVMLNTFRHIALIMNDKRYTALLFIFFALSLLIGGLKNSLFSIAQLNVSNLKFQWLGLSFLALIIYVSFIIPTATLHIYEEKEGKYETVDKVPQAIALTMSFLSRIEEDIKEFIYDNAGTVKAKEVKTSTLKLFYDLTTSLSRYSDPFLLNNISNYYKICMTTAQATSKYSLPDILTTSNQNELMDILAKGVNEAVYINYAIKSDSNSNTLLSCKEAWGKIKGELASTDTFKKGMSLICDKNGFYSTINDKKINTKCNESLENLLQVVYPNESDNMTSTVFLRNNLISAAIAKSVISMNPESGIAALSNRSMLTEGIGINVTSDIWVASMRGVVTAVALAMMPFYFPVLCHCGISARIKNRNKPVLLADSVGNCRCVCSRHYYRPGYNRHEIRLWTE